MLRLLTDDKIRYSLEKASLMAVPDNKMNK